MKDYTHILTITFIVLLFSTNAMAEPPNEINTPVQKHILAMHGQSQYTNNSTHLSYVNPDAPKGGDIKMSAMGTFDTLNPFSLKGQAPQNMNLIYDRLMSRVWDEPFTMVPLIAEGIEMADDRSWITFHINPKSRFHDGTAITAYDVLFSFEALKEHGRPNMRRIYKLVKSAGVKSAYEIRFELGEGYDRETVMILALMPVLSKAWWSDRVFSATLVEPPMANGPYRIKESDTGRKITYERVDDYWAKDLLASKGQYNFNSITYDYFRDDTIALEAFKKGDLDIRREWDVTKWHSAYDNMRADMVKLSAPHKRPERAHGLIFNLRKAPFDDINVRKALTIAFDHEWVFKNIYHSEFKRITSFFSNSELAAIGAPTGKELEELHEWQDQVQPEVFEPISKLFAPSGIKKQSVRNNLREAGKLLDSSGWVIKDGKRVHKVTNEPMRIELLVPTLQDQKIALTYKHTLKRLGIELDIRIADSATFQKRKNVYDYDMISFYWQNSLSPGTEQMLYWSCAAANQPSRFNYSGICNPALDHFASKIANAQSYSELTLYAHLIDRIGLSNYIFVPLFYKNVDYIAHRKTLGYSENIPVYGMVLESWWMKKTP